MKVSREAMTRLGLDFHDTDAREFGERVAEHERHVAARDGTELGTYEQALEWACDPYDMEIEGSEEDFREGFAAGMESCLSRVVEIRAWAGHGSVWTGTLAELARELAASAGDRPADLAEERDNVETWLLDCGPAVEFTEAETEAVWREYLSSVA